MRKEKLIELFKQRSIDIRSLGIYLAVILVMFSLYITQKNTIPATAIVEDKSAAKLAIKERDISFSEYSIEDIRFNKQSDDTYNREAATGTLGAVSQPAEPTEPKEPVEQTAITVQNAIETENFIWPLKGDIIQKMGLVYSKTFCDYRFHNGIDIEGDEGDLVVAVLAGTVEKIETSKSEKTSIRLNHGNGWRSYYSHLEEVKIKAGDTVKAGQEIGIIGYPGQEEDLEGSHLHYALEIDGQAVNPLDYLP